MFVLVELLPEDMKAYRAAVKAHTNYTGKWEYTISEGDIDDMFVDKDDEGFKTYVTVVEQSKQNADLVYIVYTADGKLSAKEPGVRTITVDNVNVTADTTKAAASKINVTTGKVTIPAGKDNVTIKVTTVADVYDVTATGNQYWSVKVYDAEGKEVNKVTVGESYKVIATALTTNTNQNGAATIALNGTKTNAVSKDGVIATYNTIDAATAKAVMAMNGKVYTFDGNYVYTEFNGTPASGTDYYTVKTEGKPAVATYEFTAEANTTYAFTVQG